MFFLTLHDIIQMEIFIKNSTIFISPFLIYVSESDMKNFVIPTLDSPNAETLSDYLNSSIEAFSDITGIPVTYFSGDDQMIKEFKRDDKICNIFEVYTDKDLSLIHIDVYKRQTFSSTDTLSGPVLHITSICFVALPQTKKDENTPLDLT